MKNYLRKIAKGLKRVPIVYKASINIVRFGGYATYKIFYKNPSDLLEGKRVLITGGTSGIGLSIAKKCLKEGAYVLITGRDEKKLKHVSNEINHIRLKSLVWDVKDLSIISEKIKVTELILDGGIDILVNNAGIINDVQFPNITPEIWNNIYETNSRGLFFLTQELCKQWMKEKTKVNKKILNISSQGAFVGATYPYRLTKWDVVGLTQGLGVKLAKYGIIVNAIAPGIVATNMQPNILIQGDNIFCSENPIERYALPDEIAELAIYLMSDLSNFIVGQTIIIDGGYSLK